MGMDKDAERDEEGFLERCAEAQRLAFSFSDPLIVHHYDADGLSSGAVVAGAFLKQNKRFRRECIKKLDDEAIERYAREREIIFVDLGGGNRRVNELRDVVIIDHHQTEGIEKMQANPTLFGIDGGDELSAAGAAFCVFEVYPDLGVVGAMGDMQYPLRSMNRRVLDAGIRSGDVAVEEDLRLYGRYCRPLVQFLAYCDDPYLPGISFREDKALELLTELGLQPGVEVEDGQTGRKRPKVYADLDISQKKLLVSAIVNLLSASGSRLALADLVGESYTLPKRPRNETFEANEFSTLLNACGRHSKPDIGVRVCLGDENAYEEARALLQLHRKMLREGISFALSHIQDLGPFLFLDARGVVDENVIGTVCGMALQQRWNKPILGFSLGDNNTLKVSGRAPRALVNAGLNLAILMKETSAALGGVGGGHRMAAGASFPRDRINEFLLMAGQYARKYVE